MEPNYIKTNDSAIKADQAAAKLEQSPVDKYKAMHGESGQADYLIMTKQESAEKRSPNKQQADKEEIIEEDSSISTQNRLEGGGIELKIDRPIKAK